jgi:chaperonin GroES
MLAMPGWAIIEPEEKKMEGMIELPDSVKGEMQRGVIVKVDPRIVSKDTLVSYTLDIAEGDLVIFKKYYDSDVEIEGKKYKAVQVENIIVKL